MYHWFAGSNPFDVTAGTYTVEVIHIYGPLCRLDCLRFLRKTQSVERVEERPTWSRVKNLFR